MIRWMVRFVLLVVTCLASTPAHASPPPSPSGSATPARNSAVEPDSPRAAFTAYLELTARARFGEAASYLQVPESERHRAGELAERLKRVLDRRGFRDPEEVSGRSEGDTADGLAPELERIATIPGASGTRESVLLVRSGGAGPARWLVSRATVARIDAWYDALPQKWFFENLPPVLLRTGPFQILWWQWLALPVAFAVCWLFGSVASRIARSVSLKVAGRTRSEWDDALVDRMGGPLTLALATIAMFVVLPLIGLYLPVESVLRRALRAVLFLSVFWAILRALGVAAVVLAGSSWAQLYPASKALIPIGSRIAKVAVGAIALVAMLAELGYPVASLIAGLGIGGLALALAAQKTVENLFGAFSIGIDQPIREGDFVKVEDFVGTVEAIGLRSTRIRTLDRTLVSIPNGRLADMRLESFTARDRIRLACTLGVVYGTTAAQMREILSGLERVLREHPKIWSDAVVVKFKEFAASSLDIEIMAWFVTQDFGEFQTMRQDVLLEFMSVVENAGSSFAFPTRTLHIARDGEPAPDPRAQLERAGEASQARKTGDAA